MKIERTKFFFVFVQGQARRQEGGGRVGAAHAPSREPERSAWWDRKRFKMIQNNAVVVGLTISIYFQQFEDL